MEQYNRNDRIILFWCSYCKDPIYEGDDYVVSGGDKYHPDCHKQMNTYADPFDSGK